MTATAILSTKVCSSCNTEKTIANFGICASYKDGRRGQCNSCRSKLHSEYVKENPSKRKKTSADVNRKHALKTKYGITEDQYKKLIADQDFGCAICATKHPGGRFGRFHVDHCHDTGLVRGLLCHNCNTTLGRLGDNVEGLIRYLNYLKRHQQ